MKMKILSPAGDFESLKLAVYNGADEIYLGIKDFNARNNIEGFSIENLKQAVDFAHVYGVRVFLAINILFTDEEMQKALDLVVDAYNVGVDAFIVQDIGLATLIKQHYPEVELHASTQMGVHNLEGVRVLEDIGFKRVVLSRETSIEEIKRIRLNSNIEIEYFVQGALCVAFSGNCYLSSYMFDASGNRGLCKQLCRLPYSLEFDGKKLKEGYLLSAKDISLVDYLEELKQAGVNSLKIEGRARRGYYVGAVTQFYRNAVDGLKTNKKDLQLAFNRGYTPAYLEGNGNIISNLQNHIGIEIGKVNDFRQGKKFNEIVISASAEINPKATLKFIKDNKEIAVLSAYDVKKVKDKYIITTTQLVEKGSKVHLLADAKTEEKLKLNVKKRNINIKITAKIGKPIKAEIFIFGNKYEVLGEVCQTAKSYPISEQEIEKCFAKNEYFVGELSYELDNIFLPKQKLNEFRREVYSFVYNTLTFVNKEKLHKVQLTKTEITPKELHNFQIVETVDEDFVEDLIIFSPERYNVENVFKFKERCIELKKEYALNLPIFALANDIEHLKNLVCKTNVPIVVNNLYALNFNIKKIIGGGLNVYNSYTANWFNSPYIKAEKGEHNYMPYMTLRHCPMKSHLNGNCASCNYKDGYTYRMQNGKELKLKRVKMSDCTFYLIK